jgi:DNA-binding XRE family transcriptional regulator
MSWTRHEGQQAAHAFAFCERASSGAWRVRGMYSATEQHAMLRVVAWHYKRRGVKKVRQPPPTEEWIDAVKVAFGTHLRGVREARSISQERLALKAGMDRTFISAVERGVKLPGLISICVLAGALEVRPETLLAFHIPPKDLVKVDAEP